MSIDLNEFLEETKNRVDPIIEEILKLDLDPAREEMVVHQVRVGGKRLRPALVAASCFLFGGKWEDILYPAAGLEILHNYTLIVDDMIDNSSLRRGQDTTWKRYGRSMAHCVGMHYAASLMQAAQRSPQPEKTGEWIARTLKVVIEGEMKDVLADVCLKEDVSYLKGHQFSEVNLEIYQKMIAGKTAVLLSLAARLGAIMGDASKEEQEIAAEYGFNLGMAFQISDDILDIFGREEQFGKEALKDIKEGKRGNAVILFALSEAGDANKLRLLEILTYPDKTKDQVEEAFRIIESTEARKDAFEKGEEFVALAQHVLELLPMNIWNEQLKDLAILAVERTK